MTGGAYDIRQFAYDKLTLILPGNVYDNWAQFDAPSQYITIGDVITEPQEDFKRRTAVHDLSIQVVGQQLTGSNRDAVDALTDSVINSFVGASWDTAGFKIEVMRLVRCVDIPAFEQSINSFRKQINFEVSYQEK